MRESTLLGGVSNFEDVPIDGLALAYGQWLELALGVDWELEPSWFVTGSIISNLSCTDTNTGTDMRVWQFLKNKGTTRREYDN